MRWRSWNGLGLAMALSLSTSAASTVAPTAALAQDDAGFQGFLQSIRARAIQQGVRAATFDAVAPTLTFNPRVVALDRQQPEQSPNAPIANFAPYRAQHVDAARIDCRNP